MHHFIVRKRQNEVFVERVDHRKRELVVMMLAVNRVVLKITQRVIHPAHVPFQIEAQPAVIRGARYRGPGGGFFRNHQRSGVPLVNHFVEPLDEINGLQILAPAVWVRYPLARLARIIQIQHGGHCVHSQPVDVIFVQPE